MSDILAATATFQPMYYDSPVTELPRRSPGDDLAPHPGSSRPAPFPRRTPREPYLQSVLTPDLAHVRGVRAAPSATHEHRKGHVRAEPPEAGTAKRRGDQTGLGFAISPADVHRANSHRQITHTGR
jgi:hypothetical protein